MQPGDVRGERLYLRLGASQARRRLKGVGLGIRKIESAGRGRCVVIHSATGEHARQLRARLADVLEDSSPTSEPSLESLRNLGPVSAKWLGEVGIRTPEDLRRLGPVLAFRMVKQRQPHASLNLLWALAAALEDIDWRQLDEAAKQGLREQAEL